MIELRDKMKHFVVVIGLLFRVPNDELIVGEYVKVCQPVKGLNIS